ncbi:MAG: XRE family transcriptional regulator [Lachnospiraceae bacterium]|nr:XRE family transcriptional regulator [Lachnospiraceae bacterium]
MKENAAINFAANLKKLRKDNGLSRKALADQISYSEKSVEKWEMGKSVPPLPVLCLLSQIFQVSLETLVYPWDEEISYYLGIDGGGTKTEFLLQDKDGNTVRQIILGASNPNDVGMEKCQKILELGITEVCDRIDKRKISLFAGLAGASDNGKVIREFLDEWGFGRCRCEGDKESAMEMALGGKDGLVVILGTGVIGYAQKSGERKRIGGWGYLLDSGGSGYNLGRDALESALRSLDGRSRTTQLLPLIEEKLQKPLPNAIAEIYKGGKRYIAQFAPLVFDACEQGDSTAEEILEKNMRQVAEIIEAGLDYLNDSNAPVVLCGGLCHQQKALDRVLSKLLKGIPIQYLTDPMVNGAVLLAKKEARNGENYAENGNAE